MPLDERPAPGQPLATGLSIMKESIMQHSPAYTQLIMERPSSTELIMGRALELITDAGRGVDLDVTEWIMTGQLTGELIMEARGWVADCVWADLEPEDVDQLSVAMITRGIERHYDGGVVQFVKDVTGI